MNKTHPIHVVFCVNDVYARYISVTIKSIIENHHNCDIHIHVLTNYISIYNQKILYEIIKGFSRVSLRIYEIDDTSLQGLKTGHWTIYTWYRLLIPDTLPNEINRVLYLDADTLVVANLTDLFSINMDRKSIAAVEDIYSNDKKIYNRLGYDSSQKYICVGVMLMNLDFWRKNQLSEKIINWARHNSSSIVAPDQDAINYICRDTKILLPLRFDIFNMFLVSEVYLQKPYLEQVKACVMTPAIIHYAGCVPWVKDEPQHLFYNKWIKYNKMLKHPVKIKYKAKGLLLLKYYLWDILHPFKDRYTSWVNMQKINILSRQAEF